MNDLEYYKDGWDYRKSVGGGWSVDVQIGTAWIFVGRFRTKKEAIAYIEENLNTPKSKFA